MGAGGDDAEAALKRQHTDAASANDAGAEAGGVPAADGVGAALAPEPEPECKLCAKMLRMGKDKILAAIQALPNPQTQKLGAMILSFGSPRLDQLWHRLTFAQLQGMMAKAELGISDRIDLLKAVAFHVHVPEEERDKLDSQKYVSQGLPADVADYVFMCLDGREGSATMTEYFSALETCKSLYGTSEEQYFNVSSTMANVFMGM